MVHKGTKCVIIKNTHVQILEVFMGGMITNEEKFYSKNCMFYCGGCLFQYITGRKCNARSCRRADADDEPERFHRKQSRPAVLSGRI